VTLIFDSATTSCGVECEECLNHIVIDLSNQTMVTSTNDSSCACLSYALDTSNRDLFSLLQSGRVNPVGSIHGDESDDERRIEIMMTFWINSVLSNFCTRRYLPERHEFMNVSALQALTIDVTFEHTAGALGTTFNMKYPPLLNIALSDILNVSFADVTLDTFAGNASATTYTAHLTSAELGTTSAVLALKDMFVQHFESILSAVTDLLVNELNVSATQITNLGSKAEYISYPDEPDEDITDSEDDNDTTEDSTEDSNGTANLIAICAVVCVVLLFVCVVCCHRNRKKVAFFANDASEQQLVDAMEADGRRPSTMTELRPPGFSTSNKATDKGDEQGKNASKSRTSSEGSKGVSNSMTAVESVNPASSNTITPLTGTITAAPTNTVTATTATSRTITGASSGTMTGSSGFGKSITKMTMSEGTETEIIIAMTKEDEEPRMSFVSDPSNDPDLTILNQLSTELEIGLEIVIEDDKSETVLAQSPGHAYQESAHL